MTNPLIAVSHDTSIPLVEFQGQAVVSFAMVDKVHCRVDGTALRGFKANRRHFVEGEDFHRIEFSQKDEFRPFGLSIPPRGIIVLTESGYLLLVKSFTDDLAWQVQKQLIKVYFRAKAQAAPVVEAAPEPTPPEYITHDDHGNIQRVVWWIAHRMLYEKAWIAAVWHALRQVTGVPSPHRFEVRHLPLVAAELQRILSVVSAFHEHRQALEQELCARIVRQREDAAPFVALLQVETAQWTDQARPWIGTVSAWQQPDVDKVALRGAGPRSDHSAYAEPAALVGGAV